MADFSTTPYPMIRRKRRAHMDSKQKIDKLARVLAADKAAAELRAKQLADLPKLKPIKAVDTLEGMPVIEPDAVAPVPQPKPAPIHSGRQILTRHAKTKKS